MQEPPAASADHGLNPNAEVWTDETFSLADPDPGFSQDQVSWLDHTDGLVDPKGRGVDEGWVVCVWRSPDSPGSSHHLVLCSCILCSHVFRVNCEMYILVFFSIY